MAEVQPIIIKKKKGSHAGAHGGAWKVAYADFVTAMMCFFLVMWLMGSDEETKAAVAQYFNNPTSPWRKDLTSLDTMPLGDKTGSGEAILKGSDGATPEDLVQRPERPYNTPDSAEGSKAVSLLDSFMADESIVKLDEVKFSIPEEDLFKAGTSDAFSKGAETLLQKIGQITRKYRGRLKIETQHMQGESIVDPTSYEFQLSRAVTLQRYIVDKQWANEESVSTLVLEKHVKAQDENDAVAPPARKVGFTLTRIAE